MGLIKRIYEDYFKQDRLPLYKSLLEVARKHNYIMMGIQDFYNLLSAEGFKVNNDTRFLINRHDIDTSPKIARRMFEIEKGVYGHEGSSTYYFRFTTIDKKLIKEIEDYGYETGFHYEVLADYEKRHKLKDTQKLMLHMPEIRKLFLKDLQKYRAITGTASRTVASHGDFINTMINMQSYEILRDSDTRDKSNIILEAYDNSINQYIVERFADQLLLERFSSEVIRSIEQDCKIIMILTHPRNWTVDIVANTQENMRRLYQGLKYKI